MFHAQVNVKKFCMSADVQSMIISTFCDTRTSEKVNICGACAINGQFLLESRHN